MNVVDLLGCLAVMACTYDGGCDDGDVGVSGGVEDVGVCGGVEDVGV